MSPNARGNPDPETAAGAGGGAGRPGGPEILVRSLLLVLLWWIVVEGEAGGWFLTVLILAAALAATIAVAPRSVHRPHVFGILRFIPFFLAQSIAGGVDVTRRALHPRLPLKPGFVDYPLDLPPGAARLFFTGTISLLPGTLSAGLLEEGGADPEGRDEAHVRVHLLDTRVPVGTKLRALEVRVADVYGLEVSDPS